MRTHASPNPTTKRAAFRRYPCRWILVPDGVFGHLERRRPGHLGARPGRRARLSTRDDRAGGMVHHRSRRKCLARDLPRFAGKRADVRDQRRSSLDTLGTGRVSKGEANCVCYRLRKVGSPAQPVGFALQWLARAVADSASAPSSIKGGMSPSPVDVCSLFPPFAFTRSFATSRHVIPGRAISRCRR